MKKAVPVLLVMAVMLGMLFVLTGCGEESTETTAAPSGSAYIPDAVTLGIDGDPTDLDPFTAVSHRNGTTIPMFMQTLGYLNSDGTYSGVLMQDYTQPDAATIEITLYDNIVDQAGNPFTAADAVWSMNKHIENQGQYVSSVDSAEQTGEYTFTVKLKHDAFLADLTNVFTNLYFVTQAAWEASPDNMVTDPVTTAPYKVTQYTPGSSLTLEAWDGYWKTDESLLTPVEMANAATIEIKIIMEASQMTIALQSGEIDFAQNILKDDVAQFTDAAGPQINTFGEQMCHVLYPNLVADSACSDPLVREAIYYAIDGQALMTRMFGPEAQVSKCVGNTGYPDYVDEWAASDYWTYDVEMAKDLLAQAGYGPDNPLQLELLCMEHPVFKGIMEIVQGYLTEAGVEANLTAVTGASYGDVSSDSTKWDLQHFPTFSSDFIPSFWANLASDARPWGALNFVADPELDAAINAARTAATHSEDTVKAGQDFINENAYAYGFGAMYINAGYPSWCTDLVLSDHLWLLPNACTYTQPAE